MHEITDPDVVARFEKETWSRCAESYADTFDLLTGQIVPILAAAAAIRSGSRVLDVGSGPGSGTAVLADMGAIVVGADFSNRMVTVARRRHPRLEFHEADVERLPFGDRSFEVVVAGCAVHHFARPALAFREMSRVLVPGGRLAFAVWGAAEEQTGFGVFFAAVQAHHELGALPHGPLFGVTDAGVYEALAADAGLGPLRLSQSEIVWRMKTVEPLVAGLRDWGNLAALPREVQDRIERTTHSNALAYRQADGFAFPHTILVGVTTKS